MVEANKADLNQAGLIQQFLAEGEDSWTTVYDDWHHQNHNNGGNYSAIRTSQPARDFLDDASWDLTPTSDGPGFVVDYEEEGESVEYFERTSTSDAEPLVLVRKFYGAHPDLIEIDQQFRLFHNLVPSTAGFDKIETDGSRSEAVRVTGVRVEVRTPLLRKYLAARQAELLLFFDSAVFSDVAPPGTNTPHIQKTTDSIVSLAFGEANWGPGRRYFSRVLAKKRILPGPVETSGIWPYERTPTYPEFIVGEDDFGEPIYFTCDPPRLANNFGANPDAPTI